MVRIWVCFALAMLMILSGCGGGVNPSNIKNYTRKRDKEEDLDPPVAIALPTKPLTKDEELGEPRPNSLPATPAATPPTAGLSATPGPKTGVYAQEAPRIIIRNEKPPSLSQTEIRERQIGNLTRLGKALASYVQKHKSLPPGALGDANGVPLLSWRVAILPYLGHVELYEQFRLTEPWDSEYNHQLLEQIPPELQSPLRFDSQTPFLGASGRGLAFEGQRGISTESLEDGAEVTIAIVEVSDEATIPWTKPDDWRIQRATPKHRLGSVRADGFYCVLANGATKFIPHRAPDQEVWTLFSVDQDTVASSLKALCDPHTPVEAVASKAPVSAPVESTPATAESPAPPVSAPAPLVSGDAVPAIGELEQALAAVDLRIPLSEATRIPPPDEEEQKKTKKQLREIYQKDVDAARTREQRTALSQKLLADATKLEADPRTNFVLLHVTKEIATKNGDASVAMQALDKLEARFAVDTLGDRVKVLEEMNGIGVKNASQNNLLRTEVEKVLDAAKERQDFELALKSQALLTEAARRTKDLALVNRLTTMKTELENLKVEFREVPPAAAKLKVDPSDPVANYTLGRYLCFLRNHWDEGLPLLAKGQDVRLKVLASIERSPNKTPPEMIELADQWWEIALKAKPPANRAVQMRATYWYAQAVALDAQGVGRLRAEKRIAEAQSQIGSDVVTRARTLYEKASGGKTPAGNAPAKPPLAVIEDAGPG